MFQDCFLFGVFFFLPLGEFSVAGTKNQISLLIQKKFYFRYFLVDFSVN